MINIIIGYFLVGITLGAGITQMINIWWHRKE